MITFPVALSSFWGPRLGSLITNMLYQFNLNPTRFITGLGWWNQHAFAQGAAWGVPTANITAALQRQGWLDTQTSGPFALAYEDALSYEAGRSVFRDAPFDVPLTRDLFEGTPWYFPEAARTLVDANYFYRVRVVGMDFRGETMTQNMTVTSMEALTKEQVMSQAERVMQEAENAGETFPVRGYADIVQMEVIGAVHKRGAQW